MPADSKLTINNTRYRLLSVFSAFFLYKITKNNGKIWIYGTPQPDGTYQGLFEVFFDDKQEHVIGIISFNQKNKLLQN